MLKIKSPLFLLSLIIMVGFVVRLYKIQNPIADWHSWRQADTASVTRFFVQNGIDLLHPRFHDISNIASGYENPQGWRFVEFPIYNAVHAVLYQTFGHFSLDEWGRLTSVLFSLGSIVFIFLIGKYCISPAGGLLAAFLFAVLPYNIYFSRVVLPEPAAVFFILAALWFFIDWLEKEKTLSVLLSGVFFSFAILVKPFTVFYGIVIFYLAFRKFGIKFLIIQTKLWVFACIVLAPFFFWRAWMWHDDFLRGIPHWIWVFNGDDIRFKPAFWWWIFEERIGRMILGTWLTVPFAVGLMNKIQGKSSYFFQVIFLSQFVYLATVATGNVRHDYYQTLIVPAVVLVLAFGIISLWNAKLFDQTLKRLILVGLLLFSLFSSFYIMKEDYKINHPEIIEAGKAVDKILPRDAKIIAPYDGDTAFLYQTKRSGWPYIILPLPEMITRLGAQYYVSVNFDDQTNKIIKEYKVVDRTEKYVIVDLTQRTTK